MYMKVFRHGTGVRGSVPTHYLVRPDYPGRDKHPPEVLRGSVQTTADLIDSVDYKHKFVDGVLSWHPDDKVTPEQEQRVMDDFEKVAFAGLDPDQYNILWVRHAHAGHHELHFVIPRVELTTGKSFNPTPPGWHKAFDPFRDIANIREGWARPDDPQRTRPRTPDHADIHNARLLRWGKLPKPDDRAKAKDSITAYLQNLMEQGAIRSRTDMLTVLQDAGLEINHTGKDYITVKDPASGEKLRLKGGIYNEHFGSVERELQGQDRTGHAADNGDVRAELERCTQQLAGHIAARSKFNRERYQKPAPDLAADRDRELQGHAGPVQGRVGQIFAAAPAVEPARLSDDRHRLPRLHGGDALPVPEHGGSLDPTPGGHPEKHRPIPDRAPQNCGAVPEPPSLSRRERPALSGTRQGVAAEGNPREERSHALAGGQEVNHDRVKATLEESNVGHGTGNNRQAGQAGAGNPQPPAWAASLERIVAAFERRLDQVGQLCGAMERYCGQLLEKRRELIRQRERSRGGWSR